MKRITIVLAFLLTAATVLGQKANWKEMHDFHTVIGGTFHPAEADDLQPTRDSAAVLVAKAKAWQASAVPAGYDAKRTKNVLNKLVKQCNAVQNAVKLRGTNEQLKILITKVHDTFHEIMEKCRKEDHHD